MSAEGGGSLGPRFSLFYPIRKCYGGNEGEHYDDLLGIEIG